MPEFKTSDVLFFFGAGASAPFRIPTMAKLVVDFEEFLVKNGTQGERRKYTDIKEKLEKQLLYPPDLEAIFTVIDGILNYSSERLGMLSLYSANRFVEPDAHDVETCTSLREKFQSFVREKCEIPDESFDKIGHVYKDLFNRFALELAADGVDYLESYYYQHNWAIFTTNYDTCLECYWRQIAKIGIATGFQPDKRRAVRVLRSQGFLEEGGGGLYLFKLHGSINWKIEKESGEITEEDIPKGRSITGRQFSGEVMLYPIAEKELYLDPYISMLLRLNRELERRSVWIAIGYSFNDPVVREIFLRKSSKNKYLVLVHKHAKQIFSEKLCEFMGKVFPIEKEFGDDIRYSSVNYSVIGKLKRIPKYGRGREFA